MLQFQPDILIWTTCGYRIDWPEETRYLTTVAGQSPCGWCPESGSMTFGTKLLVLSTSVATKGWLTKTHNDDG